MERTWRLSGLEYLVLRERLVGRKANWPFAYLSDVRGHYDFQFTKARVWGELQATWDSALADVLVKSLRAEIRMAIHAWNPGAAQNISDRQVLTGKRFGDRGLLIQGSHTTSIDSHDELEITECDAASLSRLIVERLPRNGAGTRARVELPSAGGAARFDHRYGRSPLYDEGDHDVDLRGRQWQAAVKTQVGSMRITHGPSTFGPSGQVTKWIFWEDHLDDGRYLIDVGPPIAAVAIDNGGLSAAIDKHCAELLLIRDDETRRGVTRSSVFDGGQ
ncbi:ESX secretion-associated protein EspG [Nocardia salmonicida]|uniref:ESX secretion-associated protein EspG n=1 Tax=Nocardia salmonicida TaxID=53431 RepID=UPI0036B5D3FD